MKKRIDQILVDNGLVETRNKAQALIMAGQVFVDDQTVCKAGTKLDENVSVYVKELFPYVSRGALKMEKAFIEFNLDFTGKTVCDIGSSTGGFTDFALQNGAKKVFAIDVGTGQLAQKIREDSRVVVMEKTDFRDVSVSLGRQASSLETGGPKSNTSLRETKQSLSSPEARGLRHEATITAPVDMFVCDVSFISLKKIIPKIAELIENCKLKIENSTDIILLIKPQFEAGAKEVSKGKGVIRDESLRQEIVEDIKNLAQEQGFQVRGLVESPITGAKGNVEYLLHLVI